MTNKGDSERVYVIGDPGSLHVHLNAMTSSFCINDSAAILGPNTNYFRRQTPGVTLLSMNSFCKGFLGTTLSNSSRHIQLIQ